ncbi:hypothetical protein RSOLAG22IIIB_03131 [Rhizoctonia solani]|uniref:Peptidase C14 caspase domain-containing protein n=1 Tax=Rhizoctonia solani TaxID=456999 RepID=A0A0K6FNC5_9AGAM|nr:hypothetical protein RSOLAG22IIIB_03131 [Rhizoctonia solani]
MTECPVGSNADSHRMAEPEVKKNVVPKEVSLGLLSAMQSGHSLAKDVGEPVSPAARRAVVVAVRYSIDKRGASGPGLDLALDGTPNDAWNIYNMLINTGYEKDNILLLCEGIGLERHEKPTRPNIIKGLKWLSSGTRNGDFRYFHFSGRGKLFKPPTLGATNHGREVGYYNEAIAAMWDSPLLAEEEERSLMDELCLITDKEMNRIVADIEEGCTLTTTIDSTPYDYYTLLKDNSVELLDYTVTHNDSDLIAGEQVEEDSASLSPNPSGQSPSNESGVIFWGELPDEIKMDRIKARMFAWGACHQLQYAHDDQRGGVFTHAFTTAMKAVTGDTKVRDLHALIEYVPVI